MAIMDTGWLDSSRCFLEDVGGGETIPPCVCWGVWFCLLLLGWWRGGGSCGGADLMAAELRGWVR